MMTARTIIIVSCLAMLAALGTLPRAHAWGSRKPKELTSDHFRKIVPAQMKIIKTVAYDFSGTGVLQYIVAMQSAASAEGNAKTLLVLTDGKRPSDIKDRLEIPSRKLLGADLELFGRKKVSAVILVHTTSDQIPGMPGIAHLFQFYKVEQGKLVAIVPEVRSPTADYQVQPQGVFMIAVPQASPGQGAGRTIVCEKYAYSGKKFVLVRREQTKESYRMSAEEPGSQEIWPGMDQAAASGLAFKNKP